MFDELGEPKGIELKLMYQPAEHSSTNYDTHGIHILSATPLPFAQRASASSTS